MEQIPSYGGYAVTQQSFIRRVYQWMAAGLALTGFTALWASGNIEVMRFLHSGWYLGLIVAELALVFWLSSQIMKLSPTAATMGFLVYSAVNGLTLSYIFLAYTKASIASTFFITAGSFAAVSLFGWTTKADLSSLRGFLMMGLIGFLIATIANAFLHSEPFYWILTYFGIALFIGLTAYDTQMLKQIHQRSEGASDQLAILGALKIYLDFINLFLLLLRLFGRQRD